MAGSLVHFELPADDTGRAREFYAELFGWQFRKPQGPIEYHMLGEDVEPGGAIYPSQAGEKGAIIYFDTDDIDESVERVNELGLVRALRGHRGQPVLAFPARRVGAGPCGDARS